MKERFASQSLQQTKEIAASIASSLNFPSCIYLQGDLGAGKTTLCQSIIETLGYQGAVTSPTYNLIQEYQVDSGVVYHMDLYRLRDPNELEFLALTDLWSDQSMFLIEWPDKGGNQLIEATHRIEITDKSLETKFYKQIDFESI